MAPRIRVSNYRAVLEAQVDDALVESNVGYLPRVVGENLAGQVDAYVNERRLGYYPALEFFADHPEAVDPALLELCAQLAQWLRDYARRELRRRLSQTFSSVEVVEAQVSAYSMPRVLPSREGAPGKLAEHYSPRRLRLELKLGLIQREGEHDFEARVLITERLHRSLGDTFEHWQLLNAEQLPK